MISESTIRNSRVRFSGPTTEVQGHKQREFALGAFTLKPDFSQKAAVVVSKHPGQIASGVVGYHTQLVFLNGRSLTKCEFDFYTNTAGMEEYFEMSEDLTAKLEKDPELGKVFSFVTKSIRHAAEANDHSDDELVILSNSTNTEPSVSNVHACRVRLPRFYSGVGSYTKNNFPDIIPHRNSTGVKLGTSEMRANCAGIPRFHPHLIPRFRLFPVYDNSRTLQQIVFYCDKACQKADREDHCDFCRCHLKKSA